MNIKQLWGKDGFSVLTLYTVGTQNNVDVQENFMKRTYNNFGNVLFDSTINQRLVYNSHDNEAFVALKYDMYYKIHSRSMNFRLARRFRQLIIGKE